MAIEKTPPPDTSGSVPTWFMTYSDVITLLMTFFILLLTFATSEPEKFEQMQISLFGGGGATGLAAESDVPLERDSLVVRFRAKSSRVTTRGSETPPIHTDPSLNSLQNGLEGLDQQMQHDPESARSIELSLPTLMTEKNEATPFGQYILRMFSRQLSRFPLNVSLEVFREQDIEKAITLSLQMIEMAQIAPGRVGVAIRTDSGQDAPLLRITATREWNHDKK
jgi:hypothetical protein